MGVKVYMEMRQRPRSSEAPKRKCFLKLNMGPYLTVSEIELETRSQEAEIPQVQNTNVFATGT